MRRRETLHTITFILIMHTKKSYRKASVTCTITLLTIFISLISHKINKFC